MKPISEFKNKLILGDCIEVMKEIPNNSINLAIVDPPYNVLGKTQKWDAKGSLTDYGQWTIKWWKLLKNKLKPNSSSYIFWSQKYIPLGWDIFNPNRMLIWHHPNLAKPTKKMFLWTYDPIFFIKIGQPTFKPSFVGSENVDVFKFAKPQSNWKGENYRFHPASKPLDLIKIFVNISSNEGDIVIDPFIGGGTTAVASLSLKRYFIGIDIDSNTLDIARQRIKPYMEQTNMEEFNDISRTS